MSKKPASIMIMAALLTLGVYGTSNAGGIGVELRDAQIESIVGPSYPYVAMFNVNNKFAQAQGGWNTVAADTQLKDHTMREIAQPNNDTHYIACMLDLGSPDPRACHNPGLSLSGCGL